VEIEKIGYTCGNNHMRGDKKYSYIWTVKFGLECRAI
jgi:hypothetical protein